MLVFVALCSVLISIIITYFGAYCYKVSKTAIYSTLILSDIKETRSLGVLISEDDVILIDVSDIVNTDMEVGDFMQAWVYKDLHSGEWQALNDSPQFYRSITLLTVILLFISNTFVTLFLFIFLN